MQQRCEGCSTQRALCVRPSSQRIRAYELCCEQKGFTERKKEASDGAGSLATRDADRMQDSASPGAVHQRSALTRIISARAQRRAGLTAGLTSEFQQHGSDWKACSNGWWEVRMSMHCSQTLRGSERSRSSCGLVRAEPRLTAPTQHPGIGILPRSDVNPLSQVPIIKLKALANSLMTFTTSAPLDSTET